MATTSIWSVKGWLGKLLIYAENPEKTLNPNFYPRKDLSEQERQGLDDVIDYAVQQGKTTKIDTDDENVSVIQRFVSGVNCSASTARDEMIAVKRRFGKENGVVAYHGYQSFAPGEVNPQTAHEIGLKLAQKLWGNGYQVIVATHLDQESHIHNHFVVNTVSFKDGKRYHRTEKDYYDMQKESDRLCREYGLSVIENPQRGKSKHYGEWKAEQDSRPTWRGIIRADMDSAIRRSKTEKQFFHFLKEMGYEIKIGRDISVRPLGKERFFRLARNLGEEYSIGEIRRRILSQRFLKLSVSSYVSRPQKYTLRGSFKKIRKVTGFRALYFHYCYLLGIFPKKRPLKKRSVPILFREDLIRAKELSDEARLLVKHRIDTPEQLLDFQSKTELRTERRNPIIILEPGGTYQRQDGSIGQNYYAKEIFDVSQTTARGETRNRPNFDDRSLLKALISKSPVPIEVAENFQKEGKGAIYDQEQKKIFVRQGMEAQDIFRCVSFELAKAELERLDGEYTPEDVHKAYCISYLLCRKYGIDTQGYDKDSLNQTFVGKNSKEIGMELNSLENAIGAINHRMSRTLRESFKGAVSKDYER